MSLDLTNPTIAHDRRWWTLGVLCLSLRADLRRQHDPQRRPADAGPRPRCDGQPAAVDRRRLRPGLRRTAADRGLARRQVRPPRRPHASGWASSAPARSPRRAGSPTQLDRLPSGHGHRGGADHAGDAVDPHQRLHATPRSGPRRSRSGRGVGPRRRTRPGQRRLAARALLVGLDLPGQHPRRRRRASSARVLVVPTSRDPSRPEARPRRRRRCRWSGSARCCGR